MEISALYRFSYGCHALTVCGQSVFPHFARLGEVGHHDSENVFLCEVFE